MITIKVHITNRQADIKIPSGIRLLIRKCCNAVLKIEEFPHDCDVSVSFTDNKQIRELNQKYRQKDCETDVLSFPLNENNVYEFDAETGFCQMGDIIISVPKAMEQSNKYGHTLMREMAFLTVHSMLHLLGYDHEQGGLEATKMREKEEYILTQLGLPRDVSYVIAE